MQLSWRNSRRDVARQLRARFGGAGSTQNHHIASAVARAAYLETPLCGW